MRFERFDMSRTTVESRVARLSRLDPVTGCWVWIGSKDKDGYGKVSARLPDGKKVYLAHRMTFIHFVGEIPDDKEIDHRCKNTSCINPEHLRLMTHRENVEAGDYKKNHKNKGKTHCLRGHLLDGENVRVLRQGTSVMRSCKTCAKERSRRVRTEKARQMRECLGISVKEV